MGAKLLIIIEKSTMKIHELLAVSEKIIMSLHERGIKTEDVHHLPMYRDYLSMKNSGEKTTFIVAVLSERYAICERKVYKVLKRLETDC